MAFQPILGGAGAAGQTGPCSKHRADVDKPQSSATSSSPTSPIFRGNASCLAGSTSIPLRREVRLARWAPVDHPEPFTNHRRRPAPIPVEGSIHRVVRRNSADLRPPIAITSQQGAAHQNSGGERFDRGGGCISALTNVDAAIAIFSRRMTSGAPPPPPPRSSRSSPDKAS